MDAAGVTLFVERVVEPYTGLPLLGVGGFTPHADATFVVRYDDAVATVIRPVIEGSPPYRFSTQLPYEPGVGTVRVVEVTKSATRQVYSASNSGIGGRDAEPPAAEQGFAAKLQGVARRGVQSLLTGEVVSPTRWVARLDRFSEFLLKQRQRLQLKLLTKATPPCSPHQATIERNHQTDADLEAQRTAARSFRHRPVVSILMPVYNVDPKWLRLAVESVLQQTYARWELCIADDASTRVDLSAEFDRLPDDPRIRFTRRSTNGHICAASNTAADLATGDYVALLDNDDALAPDALLEIVSAMQSRPDADLVYSDEDKIDAHGRRYDPQHKPDWNPELLLSYNYVNHFTVVRRSLFENVGRFRPGFEGSQDHDLLLRITEKTDRVLHVPKVLYHWRSLPSSTASAAGVKRYVHTAGRKAVTEALARRGVDATLVTPAFAERLGLPILALNCETDATVAVIVHGDATAARTTIQALKSTAFRNFTPYLVLGSDAESLNRIAATRSEDYLLFLPAGLTPQESRWLNSLLAYSQIDNVGAVGGVVRSDDTISYYFYREVARAVDAPSSGVLLTRRDHFDRAGGFDSQRYPHSLFFQDYCRRLAGFGLRTVEVGTAAFQPSMQDDTGVDPVERRTFRRAHGVESDINPHLGSNFELNGDAGLIPVPQSKPLRLLVAAHNLNSPEGAPRYLSEIVLGLRERGAAEPAILSPTDGAGSAIYRDRRIPVAVMAEPWAKHFIDGHWTPRTYEAAVQRAMNELRESKPDAVLANTLLTFPVVEAAARLGVPSVWVIHESYSADVLARVFPPYARHRVERAFGLATRIVPASEDTAKLFRRCDVRHGIRVIRNGIDPAPYDRFIKSNAKADAAAVIGADAGRVNIVAVGTVCERKGQHTLVEAAALLAKTRRDFTVHIVGLRPVVPYGDYVSQLVTRLGVADMVSLVPETDRVPHYLRAADVFVCTSHMETFSRSILEAEVFGLPIVSTPCHGIGEQVVWNQNALRFEIGDAASLAKHLDRLIGDADLRTAMGVKSRAAFDNLDSYDAMLNKYQAVLQQAAGVRGEAVSVPTPLRKAA